MSEPKSVAEQLDAAKDGEEFGAVLRGFFVELDRRRDEEEGR